MSTQAYEALVVGGGFYGCMLACHLRRRLPRVLLVEKHGGLLQRASYVNQARVHHGYHYPRSLLTGIRSRINYDRFVRDFAPCIDRSFAKYYAIGRRFSNVTAAQFQLFCRRIGAPVAPAPQSVCRLFDPATIEAVFEVEEVAFDAVKLRAQIGCQLEAAGVTVKLDTEVERLEPLSDGAVAAHARQGQQAVSYGAQQVFNCTYAQLNQLLSPSRAPLIPLKHELAEMALIEVPEPLRRVGITVMCGPFFSVMPFPPEGLHTLSHVRYTPHGSWVERERGGVSPHQVFEAVHKDTHFDQMRRDAARYVPLLAQARYVRSLWEIKTVLPINESDDGRPILFQTHVGMRNCHCVLGAKIDNIYDVLEQIDLLGGPNLKVA